MARLKVSKTRDLTDSIGARLKKARENKGLSFEEAHRVTKIHPKVLQALEENRLEKILGATYVKAFLRNYAHYLGLDVKKIIQEYSVKAVPEAAEKHMLEPKSFLPKQKMKYNHAVIVALVVITWLFILSFATIKFVNSYKSFTENRRALAARRAELRKTEETAAEKAEGPYIKGELIPIPRSRTISLTIATQRDVWLKVIQDGEVAFHGILSKNSNEMWRANKEIMLAGIGRPEALSLNVNGKDIDFSGMRLGKNILITREGINIAPK